MLENRFDELLRSRFGAEQLGEIQRGAAAELLAQRQSLAEEIGRIEAGRDAELADIGPKVTAAASRAQKASAEFLAASNSKNALLRKRSSVTESAARDIGKVEAELRQTASPAIDEFVRRLDSTKEALFASEIQAELRPTDEVGQFGVVNKVFSSRQSVENHLAEIAAARLEAEALRLSPGDVSGRLAELSAALPTSWPALADTGTTAEIPMVM